VFCAAEIQREIDIANAEKPLFVLMACPGLTP